jgi:hypothetical protein
MGNVAGNFFSEEQHAPRFTTTWPAIFTSGSTNPKALTQTHHHRISGS